MPRNSPAFLLGLIGLAALAAGTPAFAQSGDAAKQKLDKVQSQLDATRSQAEKSAAETKALRAELATLSREMVKLAAEAQEREALLEQLSRQLDTLGEEQKARRAALIARKVELSASLGALARLARTPSQAYFLYPGDPLDAVRSAVLLRAAAPSLAEEAEALSQDLAAIARVEREIAANVASLKSQEKDLAAKRAEIDALSRRKQALLNEGEARTASLQSRQDKLAKEAESLRSLLDRIAEEARRAAEAPRAPARPAAPDSRTAPANTTVAAAAPLPPPPVDRPDSIRPFPPSNGLNPPVRGKLVQRYGQDSGLGQTARGITVETRSLAQVVAPYDGKVMFAGPFQDFGRILILEHADGYHSLLAGLGELSVGVGQWVLAGEPIGQMGEARSARPRLYVELRKEGRPVNPLNWIAAANIGTEG